MANEKEILAAFLESKVTDPRGRTTNWIFPSSTDKEPSETDFPRVYLTNNGGTGTRLGNEGAPMTYNKVVQVIIYVKRGFVYNEKEGEQLAQQIGEDLIKSIENDSEEMYPQLYDFGINTTLTDLDFDYEKDIVQKIFTVEFSHLSL